MTEPLIRSRAPVRIDFAGGWTDVADFCRETPGYVVNAAINVYSYVTISENIDFDPKTQSFLKARGDAHKGVTLYSSDYDRYVHAETIRELEYDGNIDLVKAAIRMLGVEKQFTLLTQSIAPPGSGLGTSASMGVALLAALSAYAGKHMLAYEFAEEASRIERDELGIRGGKQDHYAAALGSLSYLEFRGEEVRASELRVPRPAALELEKNLVLCYGGQSRLSGEVHQRVKDRFDAGDPETVGAIEEMKDIASAMKDALLSQELDEFAALLQRNWSCQKRLHPSVTNDSMEAIFSAAESNGALGGKACGAGGGGCILFYCRPEREHQVRKAIAEAGAKIIDFNFDFFGAETWLV